MTFPDRRLDRPLEPPEVRSENVQDVIPPHERNQDPERSTHNLVTESARPLSDDERKAADRDTPVGERVYAPASERVPREPAPGHRDFVEHPDTRTPERQAAASSATATIAGQEEPSFTRVARPSNSPGPSGSSESSEPQRWMSSSPAIGSMLVPMGLGWTAVGIGSGVAIWMWMRWRRERNKRQCDQKW